MRVCASGSFEHLLRMAAQPQHRLADAFDCMQESRILAAVVAKNAVGSSWRKTLGSREWSRVPEAEKAVVRRRAVACLLEDPSERVAIQARPCRPGCCCSYSLLVHPRGDALLGC